MKSFKTIGAGSKKVLLFPGLAGTSDSFDLMLAYANTRDYQYVIPNYRGFGEGRNEPGLFTLREAVVDAVGLVDYLGWNSMAVAGHSMGALLAQMVAVAIPSRVSAIASIAGLSAKGASADPARLSLIAEAAKSHKAREDLVSGGTAKRLSWSVVHAMVASSFHRISEQAFLAYALDSSRTDISGQVKSLTCPILALVGQYDPAASASAASETTLKFFAKAELEVVDGASHYPHLEVPLRTISLLESFLDRHVA